MIFDNNLMASFTDLSPYVSAGNRSASASISGNERMLKIAEHLDHQNEVAIGDIRRALRRFPELRYHLSAVATFISYTNQYPWVNKKVYGPGGISVEVETQVEDRDALGEILADTLSGLSGDDSDAPILEELRSMIADSTDDRKVRERIEKETGVLRELCHRVLKHNDIYAQLYRAAISLVTFSNAIVDFSDDYAVVYFYSLDEVSKRRKGDDTQTGYIPPGTDPSEIEWVSKRDGRVLSERAYTVSDGDTLTESPMGRVIHYLTVINELETSISVERLAKANSFVVWRVGADGLPGESVQSWLDVYKERVMTRLRAGTENGNVAQAAMSKSMTASHIFVPNYQNSPTEVDTVNLEYRPLLEDLYYWWSKVFMALGIPPYYSLTVSQANSALSNDVTAFHESLLGNRVRRYQGLLEKVLDDWLSRFLIHNMSDRLAKQYSASVSLPTYVSGGEESRSEYMRRINQFSSAYSTLGVSGLPISPNFAVKLMFPNVDPAEVIDQSTKGLMDMAQSAGGEAGLPVIPAGMDDAQYMSLMLDAISRGTLMPTEDE